MNTFRPVCVQNTVYAQSSVSTAATHDPITRNATSSSGLHVTRCTHEASHEHDVVAEDVFHNETIQHLGPIKVVTFASSNVLHWRLLESPSLWKTRKNIGHRSFHDNDITFAKRVLLRGSAKCPPRLTSKLSVPAPINQCVLFHGHDSICKSQEISTNKQRKTC